MPVGKSAKKKLRQDLKRKKRNQKLIDSLTNLVRKAKRNPTEKTIKQAMSIADKAAKKHLVHKNKAARLKSKLSKLIKKPITTRPKSPEGKVTGRQAKTQKKVVASFDKTSKNF